MNQIKLRFSNREDNNNLINHINLESDFSFFGSLEGLSWESNLWINTADHLTDKWGSGTLREFFPGRTLNSPIISSCFSLSLKTTGARLGESLSLLQKRHSQTRVLVLSSCILLLGSFCVLFLTGSYFYIYPSSFRWLFFERKTNWKSTFNNIIHL